MKNEIKPRSQLFSSSARRHRSQPIDAITVGPPQPEVVDPRGPQEYQWPRGLFNFGNLVLAASVLNMIAIFVLAALAHQK